MLIGQVFVTPLCFFLPFECIGINMPLGPAQEAVDSACLPGCQAGPP